MCGCSPCVQVLTPLQGGLPQQTGVIIQPQQIVLASGNKVQGNTQVGTPSRLQTGPASSMQSSMFSCCLSPDPGFKRLQLLQAAATIEQQTGQVAAAQVQQLPQVSGAAAPQAPQQQQQPQAQPQPQAQQPPMMLQVDGAGDTSSDDEEDEEEEYDEEDEEEREVAEDGQVEEVRTQQNLGSKCVAFVALF